MIFIYIYIYDNVSCVCLVQVSCVSAEWLSVEKTLLTSPRLLTWRYLRRSLVIDLLSTVRQAAS